MKRFAILSAVLLLAVIILLPGSSNGKYNVSKPTVADGYPYPPIPPNPHNSSVLMADGYPYPPIPPNPHNSSVLMADGYPYPPIPPNPHSLYA